MKEKIIGCLIFVLVIGFVSINTAMLNREIKSIYDMTREFEIGEDEAGVLASEAQKMYDSFKQKELFIGLTVNHEDLTNIEDGFAEMIGYLSVGDKDGARVMKNRLTDSLEHLRRLSGLNFDAII